MQRQTARYQVQGTNDAGRRHTTLTQLLCLHVQSNLFAAETIADKVFFEYVLYIGPFLRERVPLVI